MFLKYFIRESERSIVRVEGRKAGRCKVKVWKNKQRN